MTAVARLVEELGGTLLVGVEGDLRAEVSSVVVTDPVHPAPLRAGALVIGIGHTPEALALLLEQATAAGAGAVLVKGTSAVPRPADALAVLVVDASADWAHVAALCRVALGADSSLPVSQDESLFALAEALAALCGGPVVIHDAAWQLLAYSGDDTPDPARADTLLGRRAPVDLMPSLRDAGVLDRLKAGEALHLSDGEVPGLPERYAAGVVVAGELLGSLWVAPGAGLAEQDAMQGLRRAVDVAALALLRYAAVATAGVRWRDPALEALLGGARNERLVAERLGVDPDGDFVLAALRPTAGDPLERATTAQRLLRQVLSHADAYRLRLGAACLEDTVFLLLPAGSPDARAQAVGVLTALHARLRRSAPHRSVLGTSFPSLTGAAQAHEDALSLLLLADRRSWDGVVDAEQVQAAWRLDRLRELALTRTVLLEGPVQRLVEHDRAAGSQLVGTLRTWFECVGEVKATATALGLHMNTVRYRLHKAEEVSGLRLEDPDDRLLAELQVRLLEL